MKSVSANTLIKNEKINAQNFAELRDHYCEEYSLSESNFLNCLTDGQLFTILDTSLDYEFDQLNGLQDELAGRAGISIPDPRDYEDSDEWIEARDEWYDEALACLER